MIFIWVFYTHGTGITSYISFQWLPLLSIWNDLLNKMACSCKWVVIHKSEFHMHSQHFHVCLLAILFCFLNFSCILQDAGSSSSVWCTSWRLESGNILGCLIELMDMGRNYIYRASNYGLVRRNSLIPLISKLLFVWLSIYNYYVDYLLIIV